MQTNGGLILGLMGAPETLFIVTSDIWVRPEKEVEREGSSSVYYKGDLLPSHHSGLGHRPGGWNLGRISGIVLTGLDWGSKGKHGPPQGRQGVPVGSPSSSVPTGCRSDRLWWGAVGLGMPLSSAPVGCIRKTVQEGS